MSDFEDSASEADEPKQKKLKNKELREDIQHGDSHKARRRKPTHSDPTGEDARLVVDLDAPRGHSVDSKSERQSEKKKSKKRTHQSKASSSERKVAKALEASDTLEDDSDGSETEEDDQQTDAIDGHSYKKRKVPRAEIIRLVDPSTRIKKITRVDIVDRFKDWASKHNQHTQSHIAISSPLHSAPSPPAHHRALAETPSVPHAHEASLGDAMFATPVPVRAVSMRNVLPAEPTTWIDIRNPSEETMELLRELFEIHPLTVEDVLETNSTAAARQKHEMFRHYRFATYSEVHYLKGSNILSTVDLHIIVLSNIVITCHVGPVKSIGTVVARIREKHKDHSPTSDWILYALLDSVSDLFFHLVEQLVMEVHTLDELVLILTAGEQSDFLRRIGIARKRAAFLRAQMMKKRDILHSLVLSDTSFAAESNIFTIRLPREIKIYLRDVLDGIYTMFDEIEASRETLGNLNNTYLARVSIEVAEASNRMNVVMKKFNAMATIVLPMTVVTGMWGMNVQVPGQPLDPGQAVDVGWFLGITAGLVVFAIIAVILFKKIHWL